MDLSTIKSEINKALSQSHAKDLTYDDLFTKNFNVSCPIEFQNRVKHATLSSFEEELQKFLKEKESFVIYIQFDDASFFGADCDEDFDMVDLDTYRFTDGKTLIYVVID